MSLDSIFAAFIDPPVKDQIRLAREEIMGYVGRIACRLALVDNLIVFGIFLAVRSAPWQTSSFLKGWHRTGTCRSDTNSGCCIVSGIVIRPCNTKLCVTNLGTASFGTTLHQLRVSYVLYCEVRLGTRVTETDASCMSVFRQPLEPPNLTPTCHRCEKTIFVEVLAIAIITLLAQAVITLRSVFLSNDGFVLSNRRWIEQNLCRHTNESGNRLVPRCNNEDRKSVV